MTKSAEQRFRAPEGVSVDFLEWRLDMSTNTTVELVEIIPGVVSLSEIYVRPGTVLQLEHVEELEYKIAL